MAMNSLKNKFTLLRFILDLDKIWFTNYMYN